MFYLLYIPTGELVYRASNEMMCADKPMNSTYRLIETATKYGVKYYLELFLRQQTAAKAYFMCKDSKKYYRLTEVIYEEFEIIERN